MTRVCAICEGEIADGEPHIKIEITHEENYWTAVAEMSTVKSRMTDIDGQDPTALLTRRPGEIEVESSVGIDGTDLATGGDDE